MASAQRQAACSLWRYAPAVRHPPAEALSARARSWPIADFEVQCSKLMALLGGQSGADYLASAGALSARSHSSCDVRSVCRVRAPRKWRRKNANSIRSIPNHVSLSGHYSLKRFQGFPCHVNKGTKLWRQGRAPWIIEKKSTVFDRCLGQQPFKAVFAKVSSCGRFGNIRNTDTRQRQPERLRPICHQSRTRRFHRYRFLPVDQVPVESRNGVDAACSYAVVLM
jgi:hypothetical protein